MKIIWSEFAEIQINEIFKFYEEEANSVIASKLVQNIILEAEKLKDSPYIGQKEWRLQERKITYRYLVYAHYKIIYSVQENPGYIKIADVFDTRQNPPKIGRSKIS